MIGRLKDIVFGRDGEQIISFTVRADFRNQFDELYGVDIDIEIKKHREKRSRDANAYCWKLCDLLAQKLSDSETTYTKDDIYREAIRQVGVFRDFSNMPQENAKTLRHAWEMIGTGWITEQVDYSPNGENVTVRCYYGSSRYNTKQMSRLIDSLVQDCKAVGIGTDTPQEIARLKALWAEAQEENK